MESAPAWSKSSQVDRLMLPAIQGDLLDDATKKEVRSLPSQ